MRKLYQRLVLLYLISALLFVLLFAVSLYLRGRKENGYYLYQLLGGSGQQSGGGGRGV